MTRPDSPEWTAGKAAGDRAELAVAEWFRNRGFDTLQTMGQAPFDLLLQCKLEVKRDLQAAKTKNVAIETSYNGSPSGILKTTATWWAIVIGDEAVLVKTDRLRDFVLAGDFHEVAAGNRRASTVLLVPVSELKAIDGATVIALAGMEVGQ
jgi:hypothetical protein